MNNNAAYGEERHVCNPKNKNLLSCATHATIVAFHRRGAMENRPQQGRLMIECLNGQEDMAADVIELSKERGGGYALSRTNATRHGILSRHAILPWENQGDYDELLAGLETEHGPATPTESHLVVELANILWRKARVSVAESAAFRMEATKIIRAYSPSTPVYAHAAIITTTTPVNDLREVRNLAAEDLTEFQAQAAAQERDKAEQHQRHCKAHGMTATLSLLDDAARADWLAFRKNQICIRQDMDSLVDSDAVMFMAWLEDRIARARSIVAQHVHAPAIKQQVIGQAYAAADLEKIARYETTLDRKFERTLAMLLKLKEMRLSKGGH
jgi:hypothetical protein